MHGPEPIAFSAPTSHPGATRAAIQPQVMQVVETPGEGGGLLQAAHASAPCPAALSCSLASRPRSRHALAPAATGTQGSPSGATTTRASGTSVFTRQRWRRWWPLHAAGLALLAGLTGCSPARRSLTVPISNWPGYEYLYLAAHQGLTSREGLQVRTSEFPDPQSIVHAYLRGDLDIAPLTTVEAVDICSRAPERCPVVVLVLDESRGGDQLLARSSITDIAQLRGRPVAVTPSTLGPYVLSRALEQSGMSLRDVKLTTMTLAAMPSALASGAIDAAALFPPYSETAMRQARARVLFDSSHIPGEIFDILVVNPRALETWKAELPRLLRAWQAAHELRDRQPEQAIALMARREGLSPQAFRQAEKGLVYFNLRQQAALLAPNGPLARNLEAVQRVQSQLSLVRPGSPLPQVNAAPLQAALR